MKRLRFILPVLLILRVHAADHTMPAEGFGAADVEFVGVALFGEGLGQRCDGGFELLGVCGVEPGP